jgi:3-mercaptopyruvate sulfurtransferase SseA
MKKGFRRVRPLEGGLEAWIEAGGATENFDDREPVATTRTPKG